MEKTLSCPLAVGFLWVWPCRGGEVRGGFRKQTFFFLFTNFTFSPLNNSMIVIICSIRDGDTETSPWSHSGMWWSWASLTPRCQQGLSLVAMPGAPCSAGGSHPAACLPESRTCPACWGGRQGGCPAPRGSGVGGRDILPALGRSSSECIFHARFFKCMLPSSHRAGIGISILHKGTKVLRRHVFPQVPKVALVSLVSFFLGCDSS